MDETFKLIIAAITILGGSLAFWKGLSELRANSRIKRVEFLEKLINDFNHSNTSIARNLLDDYVYIEEENRQLPFEEQGKNAKNLSAYLRNHKEFPITSSGEIKVRQSFDQLLDFFSRLSYYLKQKLISPAELSYFRYYLDKIESKPEVKGYIKLYFYEDDFNVLFQARKTM